MSAGWVRTPCSCSLWSGRLRSSPSTSRPLRVSGRFPEEPITRSYPAAPRFDGENHRLSGGGVHAAFEMAGVAGAQAQCIAALRPGGRMVIAGVSPEPLSFETWSFMNEGNGVRGHFASTKRVGDPSRIVLTP